MKDDQTSLLSQVPRRFGTHNPERIINSHWEWMIRHRMWPTRAREFLGIASDDFRPSYARRTSDFPLGTPDWCFVCRYGHTRTRMSDGRVICIGGEYEDWYDVDFCIYNDVVVLRPAVGESEVTPESGAVEIYGYPDSVFAPTDHHSATLVHDGIYVIGGLGYSERRVEGLTPVRRLDTRTYEIQPLVATGPSPGWIHEHHTVLDATYDSLTVRGGTRIWNGQAEANRAAYRLHIADERWECIAANERHRFFMFDGPPIPPEVMPLNVGKLLPNEVECTRIESGTGGNYKLAVDVSGVRVTLSFMISEIRVAIEGELNEDLVRAIVDQVRRQASEAFHAEWTAIEVCDCSHEWIDDWPSV